MLSLEYIETLTNPQLKAEIRSRGGHVQNRVKSLWYLRNFLWELREIEPNVVYVPKKRRCSGVTKSVAPVQVIQVVAPVQVVKAVAPVQVVQAVDPMQVVQAVAPMHVVQAAVPVQVVHTVVPVQVVQEFDIPTPPSTPTAIRVFGFSPRAVTWNDWSFTQ